MPNVLDSIQEIQRQVVELTRENELLKSQPAKEVKVADISPDMTAKDILASIDKWGYHTNRVEAKKLWLILSALRGPDVEDAGKHGTTLLIRTAALPQLADTAGYEKHYRPVADAELVTLAEGGGVGGGHHFRTHIRLAARALLNRDLEL